MTDVHTKNIRSYNMSKIKSGNTKPELLVRKFLFANGFRFRIHVKKLPGKPDIVLSKYKTVVFVNGCFWHGHKGCKYYVIPKTRTDWWINKINGNIKKDKENITKLRKEKWNIVVVWGCQLIQKKRKKTLQKTLNYLKLKRIV
ncbi:MAG: hypothetical protein ACD_79C00184G0005 [uncultured bacterium]|nr:MAG: hypothetical protein ACD_79C00184G0005 [uncultured bacterium]